MRKVEAEHLEDTHLLRYLDGELSRVARHRARAHLEKCWNCRGRLKSLEDCILNFVRRDAQEDVSGSPNLALLRFRERLATYFRVAGNRRLTLRLRLLGWLAPEILSGRQQWRSRILAILLGLGREWKLCAIVLAVTAVGSIAWFDPFATPVSADSILSRARTHEFLHVRMSNKVVRSSVEVTRLDAFSGKSRVIGKIEIAQDSKTRAVRIISSSPSGHAKDALVADGKDLFDLFPFRSEFETRLLSYLASRKWFPEVSVASYENLIESREAAGSELLRVGDQFELRHPFAPHHTSGITETRLLLSANGYTPSRISILCVGADGTSEYRIARTMVEFCDRTPEIALLFSSSGGSPARLAKVTRPEATSSTNSEPGIPPPRPLSYYDSDATDEEAAIAVALHQANACLGEEINVFPMSDGTLLVQGLVDKVDRREGLRRVLTALAFPVRVEIYTPSELRTGSELHGPPDRKKQDLPIPTQRRRGALSVGELSSQKIPLYDRLFDHFSRKAEAARSSKGDDEIRRQVSAFATQVVARSTSVVFHAWALKKLETEFSAQRSAGLSASARKQIDGLREAHKLAVLRGVRGLGATLSEISPGPTSRSEAGASRDDDSSLLSLVIELDELIRDLFTSSARAQSANDKLTQVLDLIHALK